MWHLFKIGRIPGTNFMIQTDFVKSIGGWKNGALTEDTDISFKIMQSGKLIALAYNSEAFQQEPETLKSYYMQRKRWAKGNYEVVLSNFKHLFSKGNWRVKLEVVNKQVWLALVAYFTYAQLFIIVSIDSITSIVMDKILRRKETKWVKTKRFAG